MIGYVGSVIVCGTVVPGSTTLTTGPPTDGAGAMGTVELVPGVGAVVVAVTVGGTVVAATTTGGPDGFGHE